MNDNQNNDNMLSTILDSRLILDTFKKTYNLKLVDCEEYVQVYFYKNKKVKSKDINDTDLKLKKNIIISSFEKTSSNDKSDTNIDTKNITRSKLICERLAKANMKDWQSFITLTFDKNVVSVEEANKRLRHYINKVHRVKEDFKYLCITEFQKRGAVHYHLLSNIPIDSKLIPKNKPLKLWNKETKSYKILEYYNLPYWIDGFSSAEPLNTDCKKVIGYIAKYMTKDIDNRLFNRHRYFYSRNLIKPTDNFIDTDNEKELNFYIKKIQDKELIYQNKYINPYDNSEVSFLEFYKSQ